MDNLITSKKDFIKFKQNFIKSTKDFIKSMVIPVIGLLAVTIMLTHMDKSYNESYSELYKNIDRVKNKLILMAK